MEWVEATGRTVTEAKDAALDLLGVAGDEAEFEVIADVEKGLFGRIKSDARVRARVRPTQPRPKPERDRGGRGKGRARGKGGKGDGGGNNRNRNKQAGSKQDGSKSGGSKSGGSKSGGRDDRGRSDGNRSGAKEQSSRPESKPQPQVAATGGNGGGSARVATGEGVSLAEQGQIVHDFVTGLTAAFGLEATANTVTVDDETIEVQVEGSDLGLLIGPKANTLRCVQELSRTVVQRQGDREQGRVRVDIGSYYADRRESLARFTTKVAEQVKETGEEVALEPMRAADRKVVHDTVGELEGVDTISEGSDPDRRVVIVPA